MMAKMKHQRSKISGKLSTTETDSMKGDDSEKQECVQCFEELDVETYF
jgi:hypothetical protein